MPRIRPGRVGQPPRPGRRGARPAHRAVLVSAALIVVAIVLAGVLSTVALSAP